MDKKVAVITGGSSGIGWALAKKYAAASYKVVLLARDEGQLKRAQEALFAYSEHIYYRSVDVTDKVMVDLTFDQVLKDFGKIDVLVTSAGYSRPGYIDELDAEVFHQTMEINYFGTLWPVRAVLPAMQKANGGTIVMISSGAGLIGIYGSSAYSASKFAINGLAEVLRFECKPYNIHVSVAFPPDTDTPMFRRNKPLIPWEARIIMGTGGEFSADEVAESIYKGVEKGTFRITTGVTLFLLKRLKSLLYPLVNYVFDTMILWERKKRNKKREVKLPISYSQADRKPRQYPYHDSF